METDKYLYCNHHHELTDKHEIVDFGDGEFVANKDGIPLLKALNEAGLKTRSHHIEEGGVSWVCLLLDGVEVEFKEVNEWQSTRTEFNGKKEMVIQWGMPERNGYIADEARAHERAYVVSEFINHCGSYGVDSFRTLRGVSGRCCCCTINGMC